MRQLWTESEIELLRRDYSNVPTKELAARLNRPLAKVYAAAARFGLAKSAEYLGSPEAFRFRRGYHAGWEHRFKKGQVPFNKGLRRPGWSPGRMSETQFRKGERHGAAVHLWKPIGTERLSKDGYIERKINNAFPAQRRWRAVHLLVWEEANGPLPAGHAIAFRNGDKKNVALENLELISRSNLMRRNSVHNLPKELAEVIQLKGALKRKIRNLNGGNKEQNQRSTQPSL